MRTNMDGARRIADAVARLRKPAESFALRLQVAAPATLYHYTDLRGVTGILQSSTLWATDIRFLNDAKEFALTLELAQEVVDREMVQAEQAYERGFLEQLRNHVSETISTGTYVLSLTQERDDLSQWRAYGGRGGAVSLGFTTAPMNQVLERRSFKLHRVVYDEEMQKEIVGRIVREALPVWRAVRDAAADTDDPAKFATFLVCQRVGGALELVAPLLKHKSFHAEREWRYVASPYFIEWLQSEKLEPSDSPFDVAGLTPRFRTTEWAVVPYVAVDVRNIEGKVQLDEVTLGPNPDVVSFDAGIRRLIACSAFSVTRVVRSDSPFRKW